MEGLMLLLEEYWGLTIVGGVTLGTLITLAVMAVKFFLSMRTTQLESQQLRQTLTLLLGERQILVDKSEIDSQITAATFKTLSYIVMSSKLTTEDKLALHQDFLQVKQLVEQSANKTKEYAKLKLDAAVAQVQEKIVKAGDQTKEAVTKTGAEAVTKTAEFITTAVDGATSLINKYAGKK